MLLAKIKKLYFIQFSSEIGDWLGAHYIYQLIKGDQHHCINTLLKERFSDTNLRSLMF